MGDTIKFGRWAFNGTFLALAQMLALPAVAQEAAPIADSDEASQEMSGGIADIVVTAQKRAQSLNDVGVTINVVGGDALEQRGISDAADLAKAVPGFTVAQNGAGTPIYAIRGVNFNSVSFGTAPTVSVYVDEAPIPFSIQTQGALLDLERVELLKGPQGTLFGQNSTAGALNFIAAKPTDEFRGGIKAGFGRFSTFDADGYLSGPITDTLRARVAVSGTVSGPWQQSVSRDDETGRQRKAAARVLFDWEAAPNLKIGVNLNGWIDRSDNLIPQMASLRVTNPALAVPELLTTPPTTLNARSADWDPGVAFRRDNRFAQAVLRGDLEIGGATLTSLSSYTHMDIESNTEADGTRFHLQRDYNAGTIETFNQELRLAGEIGTRLHYIAGANFQGDRTFQFVRFTVPQASGFQNVAGIGPVYTIDERVAQKNRTYALFANLDWDVTDELTLSGGLRRTWVTHKLDGCTADGGDGQFAAVFTALSTALRNANGLPPVAPIAPGGCITLGPDFAATNVVSQFKERNLSWRANVNYKPSPDLSFYANVSRGYKAGNYPVLPATVFKTLFPVRQEELTAYEIGSRVRLFDRHLSLSGALFYYDYKDKQLQVGFVDSAFGYLVNIQNVPKSTVKGFDAEIEARPFDGLTLRSAVTFAKSKLGHFLTVDVNRQSVDLAGSPFNNAPKWTVVSDAEYRSEVGRGLEAFAGASMNYNSRTVSNAAATAGLEIRAFTIFDLRAGITSEKGWELAAFVKNVGNVYTWNYGVPGQDVVTRFPNKPRTWGVSAAYRF